MGGFRIPGPMGAGIKLAIDAGTLVRGWSPLPGPVDFDNTIAEMVRRKLRQGERALLEVGLSAARRIAIEELNRLRDDVDKQLEYIAKLPSEIRKQVEYEFWSSFFDAPLPKKMLRHYIFGGGTTLNLTEQEMIDCNPYIDLARATTFKNALTGAAKTPGKAAPISIKVPAIAFTNGTLGNFTVNITGTLTAGSDGSWKVDGMMNFYDIFDFDPKPFGKAGRSTQGEIKTRVGHYFIPGTDYKVTSVDTKFTQTQADKMVIWAGGTPKFVPDRVSELDAALSQPDK